LCEGAGATLTLTLSLQEGEGTTLTLTLSLQEGEGTTLTLTLSLQEGEGTTLTLPSPLLGRGKYAENAMHTERIYVDDKLFLGRVEEQKQFRAALNEVLAPPPGEDLPYIFLLYGDGGMGKTTLAKRFRDIAQNEQPFEGEFQVLWVDWDYERDRSRHATRLRVGREHISPEVVFDILHEKAIQAGWGREFEAYQRAVTTRAEAEKKAAAALEPSGERDEFAEVRRAGASTIAKILRVALPIGETGEKAAQTFLDAGIKVGAERAAQLRAALETRLRTRLDPEQFNLFLNPNEQLARALAQGLKRVAARKPLLVFLDTYEIVDRADLWLREVMRAAGPRIVWIISGRDDLARSRQLGGEYFRGYAEEFPRRLIARDLLQLAQQDIREIFADTAPERPLDAQAIEALSRATRGIPLAIDQAAEMWKKGVALADIIGDIDEATPRGEIVQKMTARYFLHAPEADKPLLYALALARGDIEILRAMLSEAEGADGSPTRLYDLDALLHRLERDYASVHANARACTTTPRSFSANISKPTCDAWEMRACAPFCSAPSRRCARGWKKSKPICRAWKIVARARIGQKPRSICAIISSGSMSARRGTGWCRAWSKVWRTRARCGAGCWASRTDGKSM
jgi:hypothetical protein